jgi:hypothetical protein
MRFASVLLLGALRWGDGLCGAAYVQEPKPFALLAPIGRHARWHLAEVPSVDAWASGDRARSGEYLLAAVEVRWP